MRPPEMYVQALGTFRPPGRMSGERAVELGLYGPDQLQDSGVTSVHLSGGLSTMDLAVPAARRALERAGVAPADIGLLLHAAVYWQGPPGWSPLGYLLRELGCGDITGQEVHQGCNGAFTALEAAAGWFALDPGHGTVLLTTAMNAESATFNRWQSSGPGVVLGDGGAAAVLGRTGGLARVESLHSTIVGELEALHRGAEPMLEPPDGAARPVDMARRMRDFTQVWDYPLADAFHRIQKAQWEVMDVTLGEAGLGPGDIARVVFGNVVPHALESSIMDRLGLAMSRSTWDFGRTVGHMGACDQLLSLEHLTATGRVRPGDHVLLMGNAPGFHVAGAVLTIVEPRK